MSGYQNGGGQQRRAPALPEPGRGRLRKAQKNNEKSPDFRGFANFNGQMISISAWYEPGKQTAQGWMPESFSITVQPYQGDVAPPRQQQSQGYNQGGQGGWGGGQQQQHALPPQQQQQYGAPPQQQQFSYGAPPPQQQQQQTNYRPAPQAGPPPQYNQQQQNGGGYDRSYGQPGATMDDEVPF